MDGITPFLHRAGDYSAARPPYAPAVITLLRERCGLEPGCRVADIGSGTGIFTAQLLKAGATVFAVEPNQAMREVAERSLGEDPGFVSLDAPAESLPFEDSVIDIVTCASSFHWFSHEAVKPEFARVLHGAGWVCILWNKLDREKGGATAALADAIGTSRETIMADEQHVRSEKELDSFFARGTKVFKSYRHMVDMPLENVVALLRSRSYWPDPDSEEAKALEAKVVESVAPFAVRGILHINYRTEVTIGQMD